MASLVDDLVSKMCMTDSESSKIKVSAGVWNESAFDHERCLVGRFLSRKPTNFKAFQDTMSSSWGFAGEFVIQPVGDDRILCRFALVVGKERVLARGPWAWDKNLVVLRPLGPQEDPLSVELNTSDFYIQASGLPLSLLHRGMAETLGNAMGRFIEFDVPAGTLGLRFRANIDITQPLRRMIQIVGPGGRGNYGEISLRTVA